MSVVVAVHQTRDTTDDDIDGVIKNGVVQHVTVTMAVRNGITHTRVANFVESSFELLEFVNDDILLQQRFSIFAYNYVVHLHISSA